MTTAMNLVAVEFAFTGSSASSTARPEPRVDGREGDNPFGRLVQITRSNDRLLRELAEAGRRLRQAEDYRADADSNPDLGLALVVHARRKRARILGRLRANRAEALQLLARGSASR